MYTLHNTTVTDKNGNRCFVDNVVAKPGLGKRMYFKTQPLSGGAVVYHCSASIQSMKEASPTEIRMATAAFPNELPPILDDIADEDTDNTTNRANRMRMLYNECRARVLRNTD